MSNNIYPNFLRCYSVFFLLLLAGNGNAMGLRSMVALPVEKQGAVFRLAYEQTKKSDINKLTGSMAYGVSAKQTLFVAMPYRLSPTGDDRLGDVSVLYRHIVWQEDVPTGTDRLGLLGGIIAPTQSDRDAAVQLGFVATHFANRHEIDIDALYQLGMSTRDDSARYDISWQYRLLPVVYPDWGIKPELYTVLELNGRWQQGKQLSHQLTAGLQWVHPLFVIEGGVAQEVNNTHDQLYILSTRIHF